MFEGLDKLAKETETKFGKSVFGKVKEVKEGMTYIDTGIFSLDYALMGGLPEGQTNMFIGWESSGKTTSALKVIANTQKKYPDKACVFWDAEGTFDEVWAENLGVDLDRLFLIQLGTGEAAVDTAISAMEVPETKLLVLDSIAAVGTHRERTHSAMDDHMAVRARLMSKFLTAATMIMTEKRTQSNPLTLLVINQWRNKIGVFYGDPRVLPGGHQQKYSASTMVDFKLKNEVETEDSKGNKLIDYNDHEFTIKKSKVGNRLKTGDFKLSRNPEHPLPIGSTLDHKKVLTFAKKYGLLTGGGSSWRLDGVDFVFNKHQDIIDFLLDNEGTFDNLKSSIIIHRRKSMMLPELPPDGYLIRQFSKKEMKEIQKNVEKKQ